MTQYAEITMRSGTPGAVASAEEVIFEAFQYCEEHSILIKKKSLNSGAVARASGVRFRVLLHNSPPLCELNALRVAALRIVERTREDVVVDYAGRRFEVHAEGGIVEKD